MRLNKLLIVPIIVVFTSCGSGNDDPSDIGASIETFEMLEAVFDGPYSKYAIKDKLDEVFAVYNMEANKGNYLKAGNCSCCRSGLYSRRNGLCTPLARDQYL